MATHEAGAIEYSGHKVIGLPQCEGKIKAQTVEDYIVGFYAESDRTLYHDIGCYAIRMAERMEQIIRDKGYEFYLDTPTNQKFVIMTDEQLERIKGKIEYGFWEKPDQKHTVICLATSWSTTDEVLDKLAEAL